MDIGIYQSTSGRLVAIDFPWFMTIGAYAAVLVSVCGLVGVKMIYKHYYKTVCDPQHTRAALANGTFAMSIVFLAQYTLWLLSGGKLSFWDREAQAVMAGSGALASALGAFMVFLYYVILFPASPAPDRQRRCDKTRSA